MDAWASHMQIHTLSTSTAIISLEMAVSMPNLAAPGSQPRRCDHAHKAKSDSNSGTYQKNMLERAEVITVAV